MSKPVLDYARPAEAERPAMGAVVRFARVVIYSILALIGVGMTFVAAWTGEAVGMAMGAFIALLGATLAIAAVRGW